MFKQDYKAKKLISVLVEITTYCNMKCVGCIRTIKNDHSNWENRHISIEEFTKIVDDLPYSEEIVTQGIGEPTMHPHLPELIRIAGNTNKFDKITLTTNALARPVDYYSDLFDAGLSRLYVSVDSFEPILANKLRKGTNVDQLKARIKQLGLMFPGLVDIRTVISSLNAAAIDDFLTTCNGLGNFRVLFHPYDDIGDPSGVMTVGERAEFLNDLRNIPNVYDQLEITANGFIPSEEVCIHPWKIPAITADGYLVPCCRVMDKEVFNLGNILEQSFDSVWKSDQAIGMRTEFLKKSPEFCEGCTRYCMRHETL